MAMRYYEYYIKLYNRLKECGNSNKLTIYECNEGSNISNDC